MELSEIDYRKAEQAFNTLIMSDLRFFNKSVKCPDLNDINPNRKSIEMFNSFRNHQCMIMKYHL